MARMGKAQTDLSKDSCGACGGSDYLSGALFIAEFAQSGDVGQRGYIWADRDTGYAGAVKYNVSTNAFKRFDRRDGVCGAD